MATVTSIDSANARASFVKRPESALAAVSVVSFTRPADTTLYTTADVVSDSTSTARALQFAGVGAAGRILGASLVVAETDTADFDILLFDAEPTNFLDNAALALVAADQPKLVGVIRFTNAGKVNVGSNMELYRAVSATTDQALPTPTYASADGYLYGLLVCRTGYTPISAAKFVIKLHLQVNG